VARSAHRPGGARPRPRLRLRERATTASAERARTNVQKRIRDAQKRIAEHHPSLAAHLERTIKTGVFCSYEPLPS
jgi:hypothetical protein